jgi:hypothetical protein
MDITNAIIDYEMGTLGEEEILDLFQHLVNTGMAWSLQGSYGRMAECLIDEGLIEGAL